MGVAVPNIEIAAPGPTGRRELPELRELGEWRVRPVSMAHEHVLPVVPALAPLLPEGALSRGSTVAVAGEGATSLALALAAGPATAGSWVASVGVGSVGWAAASEAGVPFERLVVVDEPPADRWATVVAALIGAFDVILLAPRHRVRFADGRRLAARARERGAVLVHLSGSVPLGSTRAAPSNNAGGPSALEPDIRLVVDEQRWVGLGEGHGHLQGRRVEVTATGRRRAARPRHTTLHLPLTLAPPAAAVPARLAGARAVPDEADDIGLAG